MAKRATMSTVKICTYVFFFAKVADIMKKKSCFSVIILILEIYRDKIPSTIDPI